jgi:hypothetical protein
MSVGDASPPIAVAVRKCAATERPRHRLRRVGGPRYVIYRSALSPVVCFRRDGAPLGPRGNLGAHHVLMAFLAADRLATDPGSGAPDRHASTRINQSTTAPTLADETWRAYSARIPSL